MAETRELTIACTPDSDDAFYYFGLETGWVRLPGFHPRFVREPMNAHIRLRRKIVAEATAIPPWKPSAGVHPTKTPTATAQPISRGVARSFLASRHRRRSLSIGLLREKRTRTSQDNSQPSQVHGIDRG